MDKLLKLKKKKKISIGVDRSSAHDDTPAGLS